MSEYTPGPWKVLPQEEDLYENIRIEGGRRNIVCELWLDDAPVPDYNYMQRANANLIAAAPDLLEAAEELCLGLVDADQHVDEDGNILSDFLQLREAIARAKGELK